MLPQSRLDSMQVCVLTTDLCQIHVIADSHRADCLGLTCRKPPRVGFYRLRKM